MRLRPSAGGDVRLKKFLTHDALLARKRRTHSHQFGALRKRKVAGIYCQQRAASEHLQRACSWPDLCRRGLAAHGNNSTDRGGASPQALPPHGNNSGPRCPPCAAHARRVAEEFNEERLAEQRAHRLEVAALHKRLGALQPAGDEAEPVRGGEAAGVSRRRRRRRRCRLVLYRVVLGNRRDRRAGRQRLRAQADRPGAEADLGARRAPRRGVGALLRRREAEHEGTQRRQQHGLRAEREGDGSAAGSLHNPAHECLDVKRRLRRVANGARARRNAR